MKEIILIGAGGHAAVIVDILKAQIKKGENIIIKGFLDDSDKIKWAGYPILGSVSSIDSWNDDNTSFIIAIGSNEVRQRISTSHSNINYFTAIHPTAVIGSHVQIGAGTVIMPYAVINANATIGQHVIVNTGAIVEHDNEIGNYVHLSPKTRLCGTVKVSDLTHIGAGATVIQGLTVGKNSKVGAGATVINHIPDDALAVGVPAKVIKQT